ncbi:MAG: rod shape-determining protein MreD [Pseudomonadota bacterium]
MNDLSVSYLWFMRGVYLTLATGIIFLHLLPLNTQPGQWAPPDLLMAFSFAWALRRPDFVPALLIAGVMLVGDLMLQRPPGLLAALVVLGSEYLKNRLGGLSDANFVGEWATVAFTVAIITVLYRMVLGVLAVNQGPLTLTVVQMIATIIAYPLVVIVTQWGFGVRKLAPSEADTLGARI